MAIELNSSALNTFRQLHLDNANAIIHVDGDGLKQDGAYSGALSALSRSKEAQAENNAARTALLKALGRAFNVKGMTEEDGKVTFTKGFMDRLEAILGKDFKRSDFKLTANGEVASGRPLTMRRIDAIVKKADLVGAGTFTVDVYRRKFDVMLKAMGAEKMSIADLEKKGDEYRTLANITKILKFLECEVDKSLRVNPEYEFAAECDELDSFKGAPIQYLDMNKGKDGDYVDVRNLDDWRLYVSSQTGVVFHPERCTGFNREDYSTVSELNKYLSDNLKLYVKKAIDNFFAAQNCGKMDAYKKLMGPGAGVCLEEKCMRLLEFEDAHLIEKEEMNVAEVEALRRIAATAPMNNEPVRSENLVYNEIEALGRLNDHYAQSGDWNDFSAVAKEHLVGTVAMIVRPVEDGDGYKFEPLMEDGKPVVRPMTAEDIDALGPACMANILGGI